MSSNSHLVYSAVPPPSTETSAPLTAHMADGSSIRSRQSVPADAPAIPGVGTTAQDDRPSFRSGRRAWVRAFIRRHRPQRPVGDAPTAWRSIMAVVTSSYINILLIFIPVSWAMHFANMSDTLIFVFSFLAIIPLAKLLAFATDELSLRVGQTLAGLLNATLIIALTQCKLRIVQSSLVGSILSNLLLVLGMCFFAGGTRFSEQGFGISATQLNSSLLTVSVIGVLLPAAFHMAVTPDTSTETDPLTNAEERADLLKLSHGVAIVLLFIYGSYLVFQLFSHKNLYEDDHPNVQKSVAYNRHPERKESVADVEARAQEKEQEEEKPQMSVTVTVALLVIVTVLVAVTAEFLVDSIDGLTAKGAVSEEFVGLILLPIVGNAAEHVTAVTVSVKDKLTLSLGVAVGSSIQIALFVIPFIVTLAWMMGKPLTLLFDPYESIVLFLAVLTVNYIVQDGKSNWLEGMILMCLYVIVAITFWFYPGSQQNAFIYTSCS
ncbi:H+/Ca2+ exchanger Vxc1-like protein [Heterobasidion irregulare TC 32-1]|uniref:Vacuolar calcium ion transporter n=1 Tax=Heterobasidion irregulare (strain TC 32-1) TaxID=747525 RepID=W4KBB5_HETIT|nr:H+/Ca2+ exchanger Vxc1-like protein [Heterobasidion irregulare TC 32-1]ETW83093.1 H+/Ca2+ exchanger Vxc1-like protein [Heterobasidion irregulare TC 32-1]